MNDNETVRIEEMCFLCRGAKKIDNHACPVPPQAGQKARAISLQDLADRVAKLMRNPDHRRERNPPREKGDR